MKILITGASGFLGRAVLAGFRKEFDAAGLCCNHAVDGLTACDLREPSACEALLEHIRPDVLLHCAAYRDPDFCCDHPDEARRLNVDAVRHLLACRPAHTRLIFISTDYVFDGRHPPYDEEDEPCPVNVYGATKVEAERLVQAESGTAVLRIPVLIGAAATFEQSGFLMQMIETVRSGKPIEIDDVIIRHPTWIGDVAEALRYMVLQHAEGLFHYSGQEGGTRYQWTRRVATLLGLSDRHLQPSTTVVQRKAVRPVNAHLIMKALPALGFDKHTPFDKGFQQFVSQFGLSHLS